MAVNRPPFGFVVAGSNGAGPITVTGTQVGDFVIPLARLDNDTNVTADTFERVVSVAGQVQQNSSSNLSGGTFLFMIYPQGWKSVQ